MWISKTDFRKMQIEILQLKKEIERIKEETDKKILVMAKKILRQPEQLSKEIESQEAIERFIDKFLQS